MYKIDHQFTHQSIHDVYNIVTEGLDLLSPVALILNREQFFIEEEPFDHRLNTSRMQHISKKRVFNQYHLKREWLKLT